MIKTDKLETLSYLKNEHSWYLQKRKLINIIKFHVSMVPNIVLAPNMTQNAERKHRTQNTNTAHIWLPRCVVTHKFGVKCYFMC